MYWNRLTPVTTARGIALFLSLVCTVVIIGRVPLFGSSTVFPAFHSSYSLRGPSSTPSWDNYATTQLSSAAVSGSIGAAWNMNTTCGPHSSTAISRLCDVQNETLGFQVVFMISLPERTDKQDAFAVKAGLSGIQYHKMSGVEGSQVSSKALPYTMNQRPSNVGSWRAHLNVVQRIVEHRIQSALIFEDDADWDISIKSQIVQFARGTHHVLNDTEGSVSHSPYGDGWDLLWIGHCCARLEPSNPYRFVVPDDPTVLPPELDGMCYEMDEEHGQYRGQSSRVVFQMRAGYCSTAYALSFRAAEKVLYRMSMLPFNFFFDNGLADMCGEELPFICVSSHPTLVGISKPAGPESRGSDIENGNEQVRETGISERVVFAVGQNIDRLLAGMTIFRSQAPDITGAEMSLEAIGSAIGHPAHIVDGTLVEDTVESEAGNYSRTRWD